MFASAWIARAERPFIYAAIADARAVESWTEGVLPNTFIYMLLSRCSFGFAIAAVWMVDGIVATYPVLSSLRWVSCVNSDTTFSNNITRFCTRCHTHALAPTSVTSLLCNNLFLAWIRSGYTHWEGWTYDRKKKLGQKDGNSFRLSARGGRLATQRGLR